MSSVKYGLRKGYHGLPVQQVQQRLIALGYDLGVWGSDGVFGNMTRSAVKAFQRVARIKVDGIVGPITTHHLGIDNLVVGEMIAWDKGGSSLVPFGVPFDIIDYYTGTVINVTRTSGSLHNDVEPTTKEDAKKYYNLNGRWTWDRRPIIICINGRYIAASTHCQPHAGREDREAWAWVSDRSMGYRTGTNYDTIKGNQYKGESGHICHHLYMSKGHASKRTDSKHQRCVKIAAGQSK